MTALPFFTAVGLVETGPVLEVVWEVVVLAGDAVLAGVVIVSVGEGD